LDSFFEALAVAVLPALAVDAWTGQALVYVDFAVLAGEAVVTLTLEGFDAVHAG